MSLNLLFSLSISLSITKWYVIDYRKCHGKASTTLLNVQISSEMVPTIGIFSWFACSHKVKGLSFLIICNGLAMCARLKKELVFSDFEETSLHYHIEFLIPTQNNLQTFHEFEEVYNSLNFVQGIERLSMHIPRWDFFPPSRCTSKTKINSLFSPNKDHVKSLSFWCDISNSLFCYKQCGCYKMYTNSDNSSPSDFLGAFGSPGGNLILYPHCTQQSRGIWEA